MCERFGAKPIICLRRLRHQRLEGVKLWTASRIEAMRGFAMLTQLINREERMYLMGAFVHPRTPDQVEKRAVPQHNHRFKRFEGTSSFSLSPASSDFSTQESTSRGRTSRVAVVATRRTWTVSGYWLRPECKCRVAIHTPNASFVNILVSSRWCICLDETQVD
ncbi:Protein transport protein sec71 [Fusarium oxysporum f. sp. albedinis]|nr:Protein transport protein sec71 [Fusarium oxysporum f. sp. albedinis]